MLTIILSTFNRPEYLRRLLSYFQTLKLKHQIYVGDASGPGHLERNKEFIDSVSGVLNIRHLVCDSSKDSNEVLFYCLEQVDTKYFVWVHDDDFTVPSALDSAVAFLDRNPSYEAAQGSQVYFSTVPGGPYGDSVIVAPCRHVDHSVEGSSAAQRVRKRMAQKTLIAPTTTFSVKRTATALRAHKEAFALGLDHGGTETAIDQLTLLSGNIKLLNGLYIAKQVNSANNSSTAHGRYMPIVTQSENGVIYEPMVDPRAKEKGLHPPEFIDMIVDPLFHVKYERLTTCLAAELSRQDGISEEESRDVIKLWFWYFFGKDALTDFYQHYHPDQVLSTLGEKAPSKPVPGALRNWARRVPGATRIWRRLGLITGGNVRHARWSFHGDFKPIHHAITGPIKAPNPTGVDTEI